MNFNKQKCITAVILLLVAILSITVIGKYASSPENHQKTIASLDEKKQTVMELTAASTVTSALITLLPGDTATPIAEKMADVSGYLLVVLCAIYLEKYLVTITGYVAFTYLIPIACGLWIFNLIFANATVRKLAAKLSVFGIAIFLVVPASVKISDLIGDTYQARSKPPLRMPRAHRAYWKTVAWWMTLMRRKQPESEQQKLLELLQEMCRRRTTITPALSQTFSTGRKMPFPALKIQWQMSWKM